MLLPAGHFTQVVWKESTELGVGMATDGKTVFVVGQYRPAGNMNMEGYFEKNVLSLGNVLSEKSENFITQTSCKLQHNYARVKVMSSYGFVQFLPH